MNRYFAYSGGLHGFLFLGLAIALGRNIPPPVYRIHFVGSTAVAGKGIDHPKKAKPSPPPSRPKKAPDRGDAIKATELPVRDEEALDSPLPPPSLLEGLEPVVSEAKGEAKEASQPNPKAASAAADAAGLPGLSAHFTDFPYPWYITRVRQSLWNRWSRTRPAGGGRAAVILVEIRRDGTPGRIEIEEGSGDAAFDFTARDAARDAAPFPPLPARYPDSVLRVHIEFRGR